MTDKMRATCEFFYGIPFDECDVFTQKSWEAAWKASRETLTLDLPAFDGYLPHVVRELQGAFTRAAEAQGLKVKP
ncbi:hypothetical protein [Pseudomonas laurylsulfatiphila]